MAPQLIKFLLKHDLYLKYGSNLQSIFKDNKEINMLFKYLNKMHELYKKDLEVAEFSTYVLTNCMEKDREVLTELLATINDVEDTSDEVFADIFADVLKRQKAYDLALASLEVSEGRKEFADLLTLTRDLDILNPVTHHEEILFVTDDLEVLYNESIKIPGLRWRLQTLNRMLGSLRRGDFGFIFARPETGKTTFLASEVSNFAQQLHARMAEDNEKHVGPILWFNNEEQGNKVKLRLYQAMLGVDKAQLGSDIFGNRQRYRDMGGSHIKIYDSASISRQQVEQLCAEFQPSLVIFDQLDKIKGFVGDREDLRLGTIYIWAREIAKTYCPVIAVCQADASGEGKKYLTMDNVANAKTAKQAEADWILGIGKSHGEGEEFMRYIHLSKNKLDGDSDTDPELRHGREAVRINPYIARYQDM
jgi:hypothetical protein